MEGADIIQFVQIPKFYHKLYQQTIKCTRTSVIIMQKDGMSQFRNFGVFSIPGLVLPTFLYFRKACYPVTEREMATHSSTLAWKRRSLVGYSPWGRRESDTTARLHFLHSLRTLSLEKEMATHCSILAWRIPWTEEPGGPRSMGSQRVRHE